MKIKLHLLLFLLFSIFSFAQSERFVTQEVKDYHSRNAKFKNVKLFGIDKSGKQMVYQHAARDLQVVNLDKNELTKLLKEKPEAIEFTFPFENGNLVVEMIRVDIYSSEFNVETNQRKITDYKKGVFYRGIIKGDDKSLVAFSFFENDVVGVTSDLRLGNITLGKAKNSEDFVVYSDRKLTGANPFICGVDEMMVSEKQKVSYDPRNSKNTGMTNNCVRIYYEICNKPFIENGSDITNTLNWISAVHNNINTLYVNDGIKMSLKKVYIWESADPYTGTYDQNLYSFSLNRPFFDGDLAHLVNFPTTTSVAFLNSLCNDFRYAYSGVSLSYSDVPTYSWTIMAMSHEMGHSLGSPHTHSCAWNGNDTPIDWCGPTARPVIIENEGLWCESDVIPVNGGTIMSYCHLLPNVGVNFSNGFGDQPAALMRQVIDSKTCLASDCLNTCTSGSTIFSIGEIQQTSVSVNVQTTLPTGIRQWNYRVLTPSGSVVQTGTVAQNPLMINGLSPGAFYRIETGTNCSGEYQMSQLVFTEDAWCGKTITDSGGPDSNYYNGENWVKTFYPDNSNQKVKITFQAFDLQQSKDFLTVRNGPSIDSPVFPGGNNMTGSFIKGPFESTHPSGAITLIFKADGTINRPGFKAVLSCSVLGLNEDLKTDLTLSPNPVKNEFTIKGFGKILNVEIYDQTGKLIKKFDDVSLLKNSFNISDITSGNYVVSIKTVNEKIIKKIIKQ